MPDVILGCAVGLVLFLAVASIVRFIQNSRAARADRANSALVEDHLPESELLLSAPETPHVTTVTRANTTSGVLIGNTTKGSVAGINGLGYPQQFGYSGEGGYRAESVPVEWVAQTDVVKKSPKPRKTSVKPTKPKTATRKPAKKSSKPHSKDVTSGNSRV